MSLKKIFKKIYPTNFLPKSVVSFLLNNNKKVKILEGEEKKGFNQHLLFIKKISAGFTLIETMVAITILITAVVGPMQIASKALFSSFYARDQITAYYLAQEGIEYVRHVRDSYYLTTTIPSDWPSVGNNIFSKCISDQISTFGCRVDVYNQKIINYTSLSDISSNPLNYNSVSGMYSYEPADKPSKYTRVVTISPDPNTNPDSLLVTSTISWTGSYLLGGKKSFTIKEVLYKWQTK